MNAQRLALAASLLLLGAPALAQPATVPIQGTLTDAAGAPLSGPHSLRLAIYAAATGGVALYMETQTVTVTGGLFTLQLGAVTPLSLTIFDGQAKFLGVTVGSDPEMTPRLPLTTVPHAAYAAQAKEVSSVPTGAVMLFDLTTCPAGWSELTSARGRALVGMPSPGMLQGTSGTPLTDREVRSHNHSVDMPPHSHQWASFNSAFWSTFNSTGGAVTLTSMQKSLALPMTMSYPLSASTSASFYTDNDDPNAVGSTTAANNTLMPFIQLLVCRKN